MVTIDSLIGEWRQIQKILEGQLGALDRGALLYNNGRPDAAVTAQMRSRLERWLAELHALEAEYAVRLQSDGRVADSHSAEHGPR
jgi:hypothetical protein